MDYQQPPGKNVYTRGVKVGNYFEDRSLDEHQYKQFLERQTTGQLGTFKTHQILSHSKRNYPMQPMQEDGILRYGDMIQLENVHTESVLSTDFGDEIPLNEENKCFSVTCSRLSQPMLRNVFIIDRPNEKDRGIFDGLNDVLHYGQSFVLRTLPEYTLDEYYVTSTKLSPQIASRYSKQQLVYVTDKKNFEVCWKMQYWDPQLRIENDGEPVRPGSFETQNIQPVIITHSLTGINLCADTVSYPNIFGNEHETFCKNDYDNHRAETNKNRWFIRANQGQ